MKKVILASHGFQKNKDLKKYIFALLPKSAKELSAVIITTASAEWKEKNKHAVLAKQALEDMGFKKVVFLDVEFEDQNELKKYDVIYISGGNPFYLLYHLKKSGADAIISQLASKGVVVIGISGGGVVLGPDITIVDYFDKKLNIVNLEDLTALDITDIVMYPHYKKEVEDELKKFESQYGHKVKRLRDDQTIVISNEELRE